MEISPFLFVRLILASLVFGVALGVLHDVQRLLRIFLGESRSHQSLERLYSLKLPIVGKPLKRPKKSRARKVVLHILIFFGDLLWFAAAGVGTVVLNYYFNDGKLRLYTVVAILVGFFLYYFTVGKLVMLLGEGILFFVRSVFLIIFCIICKPICIFVVFFGKIVEKTVKKLMKSIAKKRKRVYNKYKSTALLRESERGFLPKDYKSDV